MIFITAKFAVLPQYADDWIDISRDFTEATRSEDGCLRFEWARNCRNEHEYFVVEAFQDHDAAVAHVQSAHFIAATQTLPDFLVYTPSVSNTTLDQDDWSVLGEMTVSPRD